jgi:hypothetical protein
MPLNAVTHLTHQFVLVILLVKAKKSYFVLNEKMSRHMGGGEVREMAPNVTGGGRGGGSKNCGKSVTYFLKCSISIIQLMGSVIIQPKVITLSGTYCIIISFSVTILGPTPIFKPKPIVPKFRYILS